MIGMDRSEALSLGLPRYFPADPCQRGHCSERSTKHQYCLECHKLDQRETARGKASSARRLEQIRLIKERREDRVRQKAEAAAIRAVRKETSEQRKKQLQKAWREENRGRMRELVRRWKKANPDKVRADRRGRDRKSKARRRDALMKVQKGRCGYCREKLVAGKIHIDHVMPLALGGSNRRSNLQLLCEACNLSKGAKHPIDFARGRGMLL